MKVRQLLNKKCLWDFRVKNGKIALIVMFVLLFFQAILLNAQQSKFSKLIVFYNNEKQETKKYKTIDILLRSGFNGYFKLEVNDKIIWSGYKYDTVVNHSDLTTVFTINSSKTKKIIKLSNELGMIFSFVLDERFKYAALDFYRNQDWILNYMNDFTTW